jgi:hypothetical protein
MTTLKQGFQSMKSHLPNITVLVGVIAVVLLGDGGQNKFIQQVNVVVNELISQLIVVFIGITVGLFVKNFIHTILGAFLLTAFVLACVHFGLFDNITYEFIIAVLIVVLGFASISNLHNVQKLRNE